MIDQPSLVSVASYPLFQDTAAVDAWGLHGGGKDDFFVYDRHGKLVRWLPQGGPDETDLGTEAGQANVRAALDAALAVP